MKDPVSALETWLRVAGISAGAVLRGVNAAGEIGAGPVDRRSITRAIQTRLKWAGLDPKLIVHESAYRICRRGRALGALLSKTSPAIESVTSSTSPTWLVRGAPSAIFRIIRSDARN